MTPRTTAYASAAVAIAAGDFLSKRWAEAALTLHEPRALIGEWVRFTLTYNTGAAMNVSFGGFSRVGFSLLAAVMVGVLFRMYRAAAPRDVWQSLALGLITGGALGNLLDRLRSARGVVDFIDVGTATWRFWTFNVADSGVTVGAVLLALVLFRRPAPAAAPELAAATGPVTESGPPARE
ncbi:MAG TPA: signal peptidase II [Gemmatimonadaceae bacterium]|nr:signal peptidase II [Gemmatimonadaceae bacterium]